LLIDPITLLHLVNNENTVVIDSIPYKNVDVYGKIRAKKRVLQRNKVLKGVKYKNNR
jgi:hypothetical protein